MIILDPPLYEYYVISANYAVQYGTPYVAMFQDKTPLTKISRTKTPRQKIIFKNFITFVFRISYGKEILVWFFSSKIHKTWVYKVVHGWHNLIVGWWFSKRTIFGWHEAGRLVV